MVENRHGPPASSTFMPFALLSMTKGYCALAADRFKDW
jgi:hypothetical protein